MPRVIEGGVLTDTKWHVVRRLQYASTVLLRTFEMPVHIIHGDVNVGRDLFPMRCATRSAPPTEHDCALGSGQLRMTNHSVTSGTEALRKAERATEPIDRLTNILVDKDGDDGRGRSGAIYH